MFSAQLQQWLVRCLASNASAAAWATARAAEAGSVPGSSSVVTQKKRERGVLGEVLRVMLMQLCLVERHDRQAGGEVVSVGLHGLMAVRISPFRMLFLIHICPLCASYVQACFL
jgi:hypothetical protein